MEWFGVLSKDWVPTKIKHLADSLQRDSFIDGDWIESPFIEDKGIRYLTTGNIGDGVFKRQGNGFISLETFKALNCKYVYPGDLIISRLNSPYGRSCILPNDNERYIVAVDNVILRTKHNKEFLCYLTQCKGYQQAVEEMARGTAMQRISRTNLGNVKLPIPSIEVQHCIVEYLNSKCKKIDEAIKRCKEMNEKLDEYKKAVITKAVTKGVRGEREMKASGFDWIGNISSDWNLAPLKAFCTVFGRIGFRGYTREDLVSEGEGAISLSPTNIIDGKLSFEKCSYISWDKYYESPEIMVFPGDIVFVKTASVGKLAFVDSIPVPTTVNPQFIVIKKHKCNSRYLYYLLGSAVVQEQMMSQMGGSVINTIAQSDFYQYRVFMPSETEQSEIVSFLDKRCAEIDSAKEKNEAIVKKLEEYKKSLIYHAVTGKIEC